MENNNALTHYGVKGQRWGVRRYQNKDGTLTSAGKKRYNNELEKLKGEQKVIKNQQRTRAKYVKLKQMREEIDEQKEELKKPIESNKKASGKETSNAKSAKSKDISKMSNEELKQLHDRLQLEKNVRDLLPKETSKGKKFTDKVIENMVIPAAEDIGKQLFKSAMASAVNKMFELDGESAVYANNKRK